MKKILVIGAGFLQIPIIKKAKEMGYYVYALDGNCNAMGFKYTDEFACIDITDKEKCLEYALEKQINGVITGATDYGVITTSYIAQNLGLAGLDLNVAETIKNKYLISKILVENNISSIKQLFKFQSINELYDIIDSLKYPLVVKPIDGSGSRGVHIAYDKNDLIEGFKDAFQCSNKKQVIIQDYIKGIEYGADIFVYNDEIIVYGPLGKIMTQSPYFAELGHYYPTMLNEKPIVEQIISVIKILNIKFGAVNIDYIVDKYGKITIIDMGARFGGNCISSHLIPLCFGDDYIENLIRISMNEKPVFGEKKKYNVLTRILALNPGEVIAYDDSFKLNSYACNVIYEDHIFVGDVINTYKNNLDGMGYIILYGDINLKDLYKISEEILKKVNDGIRRKI